MTNSRVNQTSRSRPYEVLFEMVIGKWISQALGTVVELGVPDRLGKGARHPARPRHSLVLASRAECESKAATSLANCLRAPTRLS